MKYSLFDKTTGHLTGEGQDLSDALLARNRAPEGFGWVQGEHNPRRCIVVETTDDFGERVWGVVPWIPPKPADTAFQTWSWDAGSYAWVASSTLALLQSWAREPVLAKFKPLDDMLPRPVSEVTVANALGRTPPADAMALLQAIEADKQALRDRLTAIDAVQTQDALQALLSQPLILSLET